MRLILLFFLSISSSISFGQEDVVVNLFLLDKDNGDRIRNAVVTIRQDDSLLTLSSNVEGKVEFNHKKGDIIYVSISHHKYENLSSMKRRLSLKNNQDTIEFRFKLQYIKEQFVNEMIVTAPGIPQVVYGSNHLHVSDFEILPDGQILLLTYPKRLKSESFLLVYDGLKVKNSFKVPEKADHLLHDYRGNAHIVCESNIFGVHSFKNEITLTQIGNNYFMKYIAPIVDTNKTKMYFSNFNKDYPAFDYYAFDKKDSSYSKILAIEDELMMELYRSEYKWVDVRTKLWAKNKELETGIDAEIWVGANYFTHSIYYKELFAPMFHRNDTLFVFDYYKDLLRSFDANGNCLDSIPIYHHYNKRKTGWVKSLLQDQKTGQIFAVFERAGWTYIGEINTSTGEINQQVKLEYRYVNKISIHNNYIYYIYRPYESVQKKYLYKERLPYL